MKKKEINPEKIILAGKSFKTIGQLMIAILILTSISALLYYNANSFREIETAFNIARIVGVINLVLTIVIIFNVISAGSSLKESFFDIKVLAPDKKILAPEEIKAKEEMLKTYGGVIVSQQNDHGLVASTKDLEKNNWDDAIKACAELELNGHNDWRLPTKEELKLLYEKNDKIGSFANEWYWSSTKQFSRNAWAQNFYNGAQNHSSKSNIIPVRAVRSF